MKKYLLWIFLLLVCISIACVTVNAVKLGTSPTTRPPVFPEKVAVYLTADKVQGKYEEIALLNASGESTWTNEEQMVDAMKKRAGQLGANAIILDAVSEPSAGAKIAGAFLGIGVQRKGKAVAIFVFPPEEIK